jgi:hypothetical protein
VTSPAAPAPPVPRPFSMWGRLALLCAAPPVVWAIARFDALPHIKLCLFQVATGRPCPGCGMTRSILALAKGDLALSFRMHPLGVALAALLVAAIFGTAVGIARGDDPVREFFVRHGARFSVVLIVAFVLLWLARAFVVPGWSPDPIAS